MDKLDGRNYIRVYYSSSQRSHVLINSKFAVSKHTPYIPTHGSSPPQQGNQKNSYTRSARAHACAEMKSSPILYAVGPLVSIGACSPTAREELAWSFSVYQSSQQCTGARDLYSGTGSQGCTKEIRNGSFGSYTRGNIRKDCSVYIYNNDHYDPARITGILTGATEKGCMQPSLEVTDVASFQAECESKR